MLSPLKELAIVVLAACIAVAQSEQELRVATRFGVLTVGENRMLLFEGHPLEPPVQGNNGLDAGEPFRIGTTDVVLITDFGGTACPYLYHFVTVNKGGARATQSFGTCNQVTEVKRSHDSILVFMHGYRGPFEPAAERRKVAREKHIFEFKDGIVAEKNASAK